MWIVCEAGFFNIVAQGDDPSLLTVKARSWKDLQELENYIPFTLPIEESLHADYRFRRKAKRSDVAAGIRQMVKEITYPKTKPQLAINRPDRSDIYLQVWGDLYDIQEIDET